MLNRKIIKFGSPNDLKTLHNITDFTLYLNGNTIMQKEDAILRHVKQFVIIDTMAYLYLSPKHLSYYGENKKLLIKKTIEELAEEKSLDKRLEYAEKEIPNIHKHSIDFQNNFLQNKSEKSEVHVSDILGYKSKELLLELVPYFFLKADDTNLARIININLKLLDHHVIASNSEIDYLTTICLDKNFFVENNIEKLNDLVKNYNSKRGNYFSIWIDNFSFWNNDSAKYFDGINTLIKSIGKEIIVMHGDIFFKILTSNLFNTKLVGTIENNGYGEARSVFDEGGRFNTYFYLYPLHRRISFSEFDKFIGDDFIQNGFIIMEKYKKEICECPNCVVLFKNTKFDEFISLMTYTKNEMTKRQQIQYDKNNELIIKHFQFVKEREDREIKGFDKEALFKFLNLWEEQIESFYKKVITINSEKNIRNLKSFIIKVEEAIKKG
ncbi:MAG: hypothetical protein ACRC1F_00500 [Metamycoplasmataceae bacterium]